MSSNTQSDTAQPDNTLISFAVKPSPTSPDTILPEKLNKDILLVFTNSSNLLDSGIEYRNSSLSTILITGVDPYYVKWVLYYIDACVRDGKILPFPSIKEALPYYALTRLYLVAEQMDLSIKAEFKSRMGDMEARFDHLTELEAFYENTKKADANDESNFGKGIVRLHRRVGKSIQRYESARWFQREYGAHVSLLVAGLPMLMEDLVVARDEKRRFEFWV